MSDYPKEEYLNKVESDFDKNFSVSEMKSLVKKGNKASSEEISAEKEKNINRKEYLSQGRLYIIKCYQNKEFSANITLFELRKFILKKYYDFFNSPKHYSQHAQEMRSLFQAQSAVFELIDEKMDENMPLDTVLNELNSRYQSVKDINF